MKKTFAIECWLIDVICAVGLGCNILGAFFVQSGLGVFLACFFACFFAAFLTIFLLDQFLFQNQNTENNRIWMRVLAKAQETRDIQKKVQYCLYYKDITGISDGELICLVQKNEQKLRFVKPALMKALTQTGQNNIREE